jgi:DNA repair protein RadA/Sms
MARTQPLPQLGGDFYLTDGGIETTLRVLDATGTQIAVDATPADPAASGIAGGVSQVRECAAALVNVAKARGMAAVFVGHVTKDGSLAGPRVLEHLVDTVCDLGGARHHALRLLRATKNRFGPAGEVGCFEMAGAGLESIADAGRLFVGESPDGTSGLAVTLTLEGTRPLACEVQALVATTQLVNPRRVATGLDSQRLALLVAVLGRRAEVDLGKHDVYASTVGGVRLVEPTLDLALCLAVASSLRDVPVARGMVRSPRWASPETCASSPRRSGAWPRRPGSASPMCSYHMRMMVPALG